MSLQVLHLTSRLEEEMHKRSMSQSELKMQNQQVSVLQSSEKQLKQELNQLLDMKQMLEKQNQELRRSDTCPYPAYLFILISVYTAAALRKYLIAHTVFILLLILYIAEDCASKCPEKHDGSLYAECNHMQLHNLVLLKYSVLKHTKSFSG